MLYLPSGSGIPTRVHGAFVSDEEVHQVTDEIRKLGTPKYMDIHNERGSPADLVFTNMAFYKNVSLLTPNQSEAEKLSGLEIKDKTTLINAGYKIIDEINCKMLLITRGKDGMTLFNKTDKSISNFPTVAKQVFDVTGAGDTVISVLTLALASGISAVDAAKLSNLAGGIVCEKVGVVPIDSVRLKAESKSIFR